MSQSTLFNSSIGRKLVMGLTGLFLVIFLAVHVTVNSLIFFDCTGDLFNAGAEFMGTNILIRTMEIFLFLGLIAHAVMSLKLTNQNKAAKPIGYSAEAASGIAHSSKWYSRSMGLLGTLLLIFLILHLEHFWAKARLGYAGGIPSHPVHGHDMFSTMKSVFSELWVVVLYVVSMISLSYHLMHGVQSAFQSLGLNHHKYTPAIKCIGYVYSIVVPVLFAAMPIYVYMFIK